MCHMKGEAGLMTLGNAFAYFLKEKKKHLSGFILIVDLRVIPAQGSELLNEKDSCCCFMLFFKQDLDN